MSASSSELPGETGQEQVLGQARNLIQNAKFDEAAELLKNSIAANPDSSDETDALYTLAVAQRYGNRVEAGIDTLQNLIDKYPDYARAHQELGHAWLSINQNERAISAFENAVEFNPALIASWKTLVNLYNLSRQAERSQFAQAQVDYLAQLEPEILGVLDLIHEKKLYKAEQLCRNFLLKNKKHVEGMRLLADIGIKLKIYDDAEFLLESCLEFEPGFLAGRIDYLNLLIRKTKFEKALEQAEILVEHDPDNPSFRSYLASALVGVGRNDEGMALYKDILEKSGDQPQLRLLLGHAQKTVGEFDNAVSSYHAAYHLKPDFGDAFWSLANTKTYRFTDEEMEHIQDQERSEDIGIDDRIHMCFAAGKAFEDRKEFEQSFKYYELGNALKQSQTGYSIHENERRVQAQIDTCDKGLFEKRGAHGFAAADPIFVVGLPRAGSTLLEQILASHSLVDGTMELHNILALAHRLRGRNSEKNSKYPAILHEIDTDYFSRFGEQYINDTRVYRGKAPYFIDKMPNNFLHVGLIKLILPNAKVIDARRHPLSCCFSGFKQLFGEGQEFSYGLKEIGSYYRNYVRLMDHWDEVLPGFVLRVMYEDVIDDLEGQVRRILDFCELEFKESCINFHETERSIRTPSSEQVRQPIFRSGVEQWLNYEPWLGQLKETLGNELLARFPVSG